MTWLAVLAALNLPFVVAAGLVMLLTVLDPFERRRTYFNLPHAQQVGALQMVCETSLCPLATEVSRRPSSARVLLPRPQR